MIEKPQVVPTTSHVSAVIDQVLLRALRQIASKLEHGLHVDVCIYRHKEMVQELGSFSSGNDSELLPQKGKTRIRFRETFVPDRFVFCLDSLFVQDSRAPDFSGFRIKGDVRKKGGVVVANMKGIIINYNDWDWHDWL